jgi:hypothetical protein
MKGREGRRDKEKASLYVTLGLLKVYNYSMWDKRRE